MIRVEEVSFAYPSGIEALKEVSVEIQDGEFVAIMGENGAGKTTLVKHFNGILKPTEGEVYVNDRNTKERSVAELSREVGLVFQNPDHQLFCETVEEEVTFALKNFGYAEAAISDRVSWALDLLSLASMRKTSPFMLSGGERKRVALAAVLAWDPQIIVLDEPTIGQDYVQKQKLHQFIVKLNSQGRTVIMVTHDVEFVAECNPRIVVMSQGRIIADGPAKKVLTDYDLLAQASLIPPQLTQLFNQLSDLELPQAVIDLHGAKAAIGAVAKRKRGLWKSLKG